MKTFTIEVSYTFTGTYQVNAESKQQAIEIVENSCGCVGPTYHTTLSDEQIPDWEFPVHPETKLVSIM